MIRVDNVRSIRDLISYSGMIDMRSFQSVKNGAVVGTKNYCETIDDFHVCGHKACIAGYVAISKEFHAQGGYCTTDGAPSYKDGRDMSAKEAMAEFFGIPFWLSADMILGQCEDLENYVEKEWKHWGREEAVLILDKVIEIGEKYATEVGQKRAINKWLGKGRV